MPWRMNPFLWVQEIDLFHTLALLLWTPSQMKASVLGSMWFPLSVPRRSQALGTQGKAVQNPASVNTEWDAAQCTQGFQLCPHDWDTLRKPHWLIETRADLSTWWIQMPFVIRVKWIQPCVLIKSMKEEHWQTRATKRLQTPSAVQAPNSFSN